MVSSETIKSDANSLENYLNKYLTEINTLNSSWSGPSHDSISAQAEAFVSSYKAIVTQMNNLANACSKYKQYLLIKQTIKTENIKKEKLMKNKQQNNNLVLPINTIINNLNSQLTQKKEEIISNLFSASTPTLKADLINSFQSSTISNLNNSNVVDSIISQEGNVISDYSDKGFHSDNWCADFVSYTLINSGYDMEWASLAGDNEPGTIFQSLRDSGAQIHLDIGSKAHGITDSNPEYDPNYTPQKGDVVVFDWKKNGMGVNDHTGFIIKDNGDGTVTTIEGNTEGKSGDSCVAIKTRDKSEIYGYATPLKYN